MRWIAVVPTGIITAVLIMFPIHWFLILWVNIGDAPLFGLISPETIEHIERLIIAFTVPFIIIYIGALIAPTHHMKTGIALAIITALGLGIIYTLVFTGNSYLIGWSTFYFGATPILNLAGITIPLYKLRSKYQSPLNKSDRLKWSKSKRLNNFKSIPMNELSVEELLTLREKYSTDESAVSIFDDELASRVDEITSASLSEAEKESK